MRNSKTLTIAKKELHGYFITPIAYIFIIMFLVLSMSFTFYIGGFFERNQADLQSFFAFHPWLYLMLLPSLSMRLWSEERKTGTIELTMTLPISITQIVLGKFLASWAFSLIALFLTFPIFITVNILGSPDNGVIIASYIASFLMAGAFLAIGSCISALSKSQVVSFILTVSVCFSFMMSGLEAVLNFISKIMPEVMVKTIASFSFLTHFSSVTRGVIDVRDVIFFLALIAFWLFANIVIVNYKKIN